MHLAAGTGQETLQLARDLLSTTINEDGCDSDLPVCPYLYSRFATVRTRVDFVTGIAIRTRSSSKRGSHLSPAAVKIFNRAPHRSHKNSTNENTPSVILDFTPWVTFQQVPSEAGLEAST